MSESSGPTEPDQRVERDVENLISEAATLADDLSDEVVGDDAAAPENSERERRFFESHATSEPDIESQLSTAADQAADASNEIGNATQMDSTAISTKPPAADPSNDSSNESDALSAIESSPPAPKKAPKKLVLPPRGAKKVSSDSDTAAKTDARVKPDATGGAGKQADGETVKAVPFNDTDMSNIDGGYIKAPTTGSQSAAVTSESTPTGPRPTSPMLTHVASMLNGSALILARVLERLDRPFGRLGPNVRMLAGWISLILFVASISLLIFVVL